MVKTLVAERRLAACVALAAALLVLALFFSPAPPLGRGTEIYQELNFMVIIPLQIFLLGPILWLGRGLLLGGARRIICRKPGMESLLAVGVGAALLYSLVSALRVAMGQTGGAGQLYFCVAGVAVTLALFGRRLEERAGERAWRDASGLFPAWGPAALLADGRRRPVPVAELKAGDEIVVGMGEIIPVAGVILSGHSAVDEAGLTGRSEPVDKIPGDRVLAGSFNRTGELVVRVEEPPAPQANPAEGGGGGFPRLADRLGGKLVHSLAILAGAAWVVGMFATRGDFFFACRLFLSVLIAACPAALGLGVPAAILAGTVRGQEKNVFIREAWTLESVCKIDVIALDKTGTLTLGEPAVAELIPASADGRALLHLAACVCRVSGHPYARAIVRRAGEAGLVPLEVERFVNLPGRGTIANIGRDVCHVGVEGLMADSGIPIPEGLELEAYRLEGEGRVPLFLAKNGQVLGILALADAIRPTTAAAVRELTRQGMDVIMLTGDIRQVAASIAAQAGVTELLAGVMPQEKAAEIRRLQAAGKRVAMVGNGENDLPAIAQADIGAVMVGGPPLGGKPPGAGCLRRPAGEMVIAGDLADLAGAFALSRATGRKVRQNLIIAAGFGVVTAAIGAGVFYPLGGLLLSPGIALAAICLGAGSALFNALALSFY